MPYLQKRARTNSSFFFFNDTATTEIYTLSLHDALPISFYRAAEKEIGDIQAGNEQEQRNRSRQNKQCCTQIDRKSTRLNSSHGYISYAVFCLKKKKHAQGRQDRHHAPSDPHAAPP